MGMVMSKAEGAHTIFQLLVTAPDMPLTHFWVMLGIWMLFVEKASDFLTKQTLNPNYFTFAASGTGVGANP